MRMLGKKFAAPDDFNAKIEIWKRVLGLKGTGNYWVEGGTPLQF